MNRIPKRIPSKRRSPRFVQRDDRNLWQSSLRRILGYTSRATLAEMLPELEKRLWIRRKRSLEDRRQLEVTLTLGGKYALWQCYGRFAGAWAVEAPTFAMGWWWWVDQADVDAWNAYRAKRRPLHKILHYMRFALRDQGSLRYPMWD